MPKRPASPVAEYIAACPKDVQAKLKTMRAAVREAAPGAAERTDYFQMPGYSYEGGFDYDGLFAWFSFKRPYVRLHVRPLAIEQYRKALAGYRTSRGIVNFPADDAVPVALVKKLVKASVRAMKAGA